MEAFTLLKYWRGSGGLGPSSAAAATTTTSPTTTTILTAVAHNENATESDEGPFFDLEFALPDQLDDSEDGHQNPNANQVEDEDEDDNINIEESDGESESEREFKFTLSPSSNDRSDPDLSLSPSDDMFLKGKLVQVEPSSSSEPNSKPQFTASLLKSATKFRVFMLGLKKSKSSDKDSTGSDSVPHQPESQKKQRERKLFTVKFKVEEVPIVSLFTRDNSSRGNNKTQSQDPEESPSASDNIEKRFSKEVMQKYLKMVKPLYIKVSRRYGDKLGQLNLSSGGGGGGKAAAPPPSTAEEKPSPVEGDADVKSQKQGNLPAKLRVACKHLGKSRSASSAVAAAPPPAFVSSKRRDDSLLQQQDGIQGAILHCKRSFNASTECESSPLPRSVSDSLHDISRKSTKEGL